MRNNRMRVCSLLLVGGLLACVLAHRSAVKAFANTETARRQKMNAKISVVRADTLFDAIEQIRRQSGFAIRVDHESLAAGAIDAQTTCRVRLFDVTLAESITAIDQFYYLRTRLGWWWEGDTLAIGTPEEASGHSVTLRAYDVSDLAWADRADNPVGKAPNLCFGGSISNSGGGGGVTGGGLFGGRGGSCMVNPTDKGPLAALIMDTVSPDVWRENGGAKGTIRRFGGCLFITQTPENHAKIAEFLNQLRAIGSWD